MKLSIKRIWQLIILISLPIIIYNTKSSYYQNKVDFYEKNINGAVTKIKQTLGTKIYYNETDFFYLEQLENKSLKVGDSINKKMDSDLTVFEKNESGQYIYLTKIKVMKPKSSYFKFFFGF